MLWLAAALPALLLPGAAHEIDPFAEYCLVTPNQGTSTWAIVEQGQSVYIETRGRGFTSAIAGAEYIVTPEMPVNLSDHHHGQNGNPMDPQDGSWGGTTETATTTNDTTTLPLGNHTVYVHVKSTKLDGVGLPLWSAFKTCVIEVRPPPPPPPVPPSNVTTSLQGADLALSWSPSPWPLLDHYNIYRAVNDVNGFSFAPSPPYATVPPGTTSWVDFDANEAYDGQQYFYVVRAADGANNEDSNTEVSGKVPVNLVQGVNEFAIPFILEDVSTSAVFAHLVGQFTSVAQYLPGTGWQFYNVSGPQDLLSIDSRYGVRVHMAQPSRFVGIGRVADTTATNLTVGWNFVSYRSLVPAVVAPALDNNGLSGAYDHVLVFTPDRYDAWRFYRPAEASDLSVLSPGMGVWIRATQARTWTLAGT